MKRMNVTIIRRKKYGHVNQAKDVAAQNHHKDVSPETAAALLKDFRNDPLGMWFICEYSDGTGRTIKKKGLALK